MIGLTNKTLSWQKVILGTILDKPSSFSECSSIKENDFIPMLKIIWKIIKETADAGDLSRTVVLELLRQRELMDMLGEEEGMRGEDYFIALLGYADDIALPRAIEEVSNAGMKEELNDLAMIMAAQSRNGVLGKDIINEMLDSISSIGRSGNNSNFFIGDSVSTFVERMEQQRLGKQVPGWTPALKGIRDVVGTSSQVELIIWGSRPGMGKTAQLIFDAIYQVTMNNYYVITFNGENPPDWYKSRSVAFLTGIPAHKIERAHLLTPEEYEIVKAALKEVENWPWIIRPMMSPADMKFTVKQAVAKYGERVLVQVDQINNMIGSFKGDGEFARVNAATYFLRNLTKDLGVPVMAVHQLNRPKEQPFAKPRKEELQYGGEQASTLIISPWEQELTDSEAALFPSNVRRNMVLPYDNRVAKVMKFVVLKNSNGPKGQTDDHVWHQDTNRYELLEEGWREVQQKPLARPTVTQSTFRPLTKEAQTHDGDKEPKAKKRWTS